MGDFHNKTLVSVAIPFAARAFVGKTDKTGREGAILHSLRVDKLVQKARGGELAEAAALLHDTIEDTAVTEQDIRNEFADFGSETVEKLIAVVLSVTRGYIHRETKEMVFSPPPREQVCDCEFRRCTNPVHLYEKEKYRHFIERSKRNPLGRIVKIADITDNSSPSRIEGLSEEEKGIVEERYIPALAFLRDPNATEFYTPRQLARECRFCHQTFAKHEGRERTCPVKGLFPDQRTFKGVK